ASSCICLWWRSTAFFGATAPATMEKSALQPHTVRLVLCADSVPERKDKDESCFFADIGSRKDQGTVCHRPGTGAAFSRQTLHAGRPHDWQHRGSLGFQLVWAGTV